MYRFHSAIAPIRYVPVAFAAARKRYSTRSIFAAAVLCLQSACGGGNDVDVPIDPAPVQETVVIFAYTSLFSFYAPRYASDGSLQPQRPLSEIYLEDLHSRSVSVLQYACYKEAEMEGVGYVDIGWEIAFRIPAADLVKLGGSYRTTPMKIEGGAFDCAANRL